MNSEKRAIIFACEGGSGKSVVAADLFKSALQERELSHLYDVYDGGNNPKTDLNPEVYQWLKNKGSHRINQAPQSISSIINTCKWRALEVCIVCKDTCQIDETEEYPTDYWCIGSIKKDGLSIIINRIQRKVNEKVDTILKKYETWEAVPFLTNEATEMYYEK